MKTIASLLAIAAAVTLTACGGGDDLPTATVAAVNLPTAIVAPVNLPTAIVAPVNIPAGLAVGTTDRACRDAAGNDVVCP